MAEQDDNLTVVLLIDDSWSMSGDKTNNVKVNMKGLIGGFDKCAFFKFGSDLTHITGPTTDIQTVSDSIDKSLKTNDGTRIEHCLLKCWNDISLWPDNILLYLITDAEDKVSYDTVLKAYTETKNKFAQRGKYLITKVMLFGSNTGESTETLKKIISRYGIW